MENNGSFYDEDYYNHGIESGKSCYFNYTWLPELTIPMAMTMVDLLEIRPHHTVLDFGCSKGYLVKAMRLLNRKAWGVDISRYAIDNCDKAAKPYCYHISDFYVTNHIYDFVIAKDVFEHIDVVDLCTTLKIMPGRKLFAVVPLGDGTKYRAPANDFDKSHAVCQPESWWIDCFDSTGWTLEDFTFKVPGIKESYYEKYPQAHGFFICSKSL